MSRYIFIFRSRTRAHISLSLSLCMCVYEHFVCACYSMHSLDYARENRASVSTWTNAQTAYIHTFLNFMLSSYSICCSLLLLLLLMFPVFVAHFIFNRCVHPWLCSRFLRSKIIGNVTFYLFMHFNLITLPQYLNGRLMSMPSSVYRSYSGFVVHTVYRWVGRGCDQPNFRYVYSCVYATDEHAVSITRWIVFFCTMPA